jgi:hypothetical protein
MVVVQGRSGMEARVDTEDRAAVAVIGARHPGRGGAGSQVLRF